MEITDTKKQRITPKNGVKIIVEREFTDKRTLAEAFIPILYDAVCRDREKARTNDNRRVSS